MGAPYVIHAGGGALWSIPQGRFGTEVIEAAHADPRKHLPPVVVCTALAGSYLAAFRSVLEGSGARIIDKPFDVAMLVAVLRAAADDPQR